MSSPTSNVHITGPVMTDELGQIGAVEAESKLTAGALYSGIVVATDWATKKSTVLIADSVRAEGCVYAPGLAASLVGVNTTALPPIGSQVLCVYTNPTVYILGTKPSLVNTPLEYPGNITGQGWSQYTLDNIKPVYDMEAAENDAVKSGYSPSSDLLPGEEEFTNGLGVMIRLLSNFVQLNAGDLAKVEAHLTNDMVRIVSNYFANHTCGGDQLIWNANGRCTSEEHFSGYLFESEGKLSETAPLCETNDTNIYTIADIVTDEVSAFDATGRWRLSRYIGYLGDMIHTWITNPTDVITTYADNAIRQARFRSWVGSDGTVVVQTAGDIAIELTQYIPVPTIHHKWDNPDMDLEKIMKDLDTNYLRLWGAGQNWKNLQVSCWQLNQYLKYMTLWQSLARFRQLAGEDKYCTLATEVESRVGGEAAGEEDKLSVNPTANKSEVSGHTLLHLSRTGSISMVVNGATSIIVDAGNIQISAPNNIELLAGGTVNIHGRDVSIKALRNMEIVSLIGRIAMKARTAFDCLCECGRMWLKCDADKEAIAKCKEAYTGSNEDDYMEPSWRKHGIVLDSTNSPIMIYGKDGILAATREKDIVLQPGRDSIINAVAGDSITKCINSFTRATKLFDVDTSIATMDAGVFNVGRDRVQFAGPTLYAPRIVVDTSIHAMGVITTKSGAQTIPANTKTKFELVDTKDAHDEASNAYKSITINNYFKDEFANGAVTWSYSTYLPASLESVLDPNARKADYWTSYVKINSLEDSCNAVLWNSSSNRLMAAERTVAGSLPWPGNAPVYEFSRATQTMDKPMTEHFTEAGIGSIKDMQITAATTFYQPQPKQEIK